MADANLEQSEIDRLLHNQGLEPAQVPDSTHKAPHTYTANERAQELAQSTPYTPNRPHLIKAEDWEKKTPTGK